MITKKIMSDPLDTIDPSKEQKMRVFWSTGFGMAGFVFAILSLRQYKEFMTGNKEIYTNFTGSDHHNILYTSPFTYPTVSIICILIALWSWNRFSSSSVEQ